MSLVIFARSKTNAQKPCLKIVRRTGYKTAVPILLSKKYDLQNRPNWTLCITASGEMLVVYHRHRPKPKIIAEHKETQPVAA